MYRMSELLQLDRKLFHTKDLAVRAVAHANGANQLAIVIPYHRVIHANGDLAGPTSVVSTPG